MYKQVSSVPFVEGQSARFPCSNNLFARFNSCFRAGKSAKRVADWPSSSGTGEPWHTTSWEVMKDMKQMGIMVHPWDFHALGHASKQAILFTQNRSAPHEKEPKTQNAAKKNLECQLESSESILPSIMKCITTFWNVLENFLWKIKASIHGLQLNTKQIM